MFPQSFARDGFKPLEKRKRRRLLIGTEGESESGKTEFIATAPGPGIIICLDRGHEAMLENPNPPKTRRNDYIYHVMKILLDTQGHKTDYMQSWQEFKMAAYKAVANPDALTVGIDTDNASWELQQLADFGKLTQIPPILRTGVNASRRAFIAKLADSGKNIIATNMLKDEYKAAVDGNGVPVMKDGKEIQEKTGERKRQGFGDQSYLWQVQLRHLQKPAEMIKVGGRVITTPSGKEIQIGGKMEKVSPQYGIRILKCKMNSELVGSELWGDKCNFKGLVSLMYPNIPLNEWGF